MSRFLLLLLAFYSFTAAVAEENRIEESEEDCLLRLLKAAPADSNVGDLQERCRLRSSVDFSGALLEPSTDERLPTGMIRKRQLVEDEISKNRFAILQHYDSYLLPFAYNFKPNSDPFDAIGDKAAEDNLELSFQVSLKVRLTDYLYKNNARLFAGYTNKSFWQVYNAGNSRPFRETNHQLELFTDINTDYEIGGWDMPSVRVGLVHQSNGRAKPLSRSWDRIYAQFLFEHDNWVLSFKPWYRFPEENSKDDNPDINKYMGNFEFGVLRQGSNSSTSIMLRNNLRKDNKGAVEVSWSSPIRNSNDMHLFVQYFYGYGESLIDYDAISHRFSVGLRLNSLL